MFKKFINKYKEEKQQKELLLARKDALLKEIAELEKERDRVKAHHELGNELQKLEDEREYLKLFYGNRYGSYGIWEDIPGHERWDGTFSRHILLKSRKPVSRTFLRSPSSGCAVHLLSPWETHHPNMYIQTIPCGLKPLFQVRKAQSSN